MAALCGALGVVLAGLWVTPSGQLRDAVHWRAPAAMTTDYSAAGAGLAQTGVPDVQPPAALLERPLFSSTRRPPEPVAAAPVDAASDRLGTARLRAIVDSPPAGGSIILEIDGKSHRIQKQGVFEGWTLASMSTDTRTATMARNGQTRVLSLQRGELSAGAARARASGARAPLPRPAPSVSTSRGVPRRGSAVAPPAQATQAPAAAEAPPAPPTFGAPQR
jgi:hypothetical protein